MKFSIIIFFCLSNCKCFLLNKPLLLRQQFNTKIYNSKINLNMEHKISNELILTINNTKYNLTSWQNNHPGGYKILQKYNNKDATKEFYKIKHSQYAIELLEKIRSNSSNTSELLINDKNNNWMEKLFTEEDKNNLHKILGIYCLLHFLYRYSISLTFDINGGIDSSFLSIITILIHGLLSFSSLKFYVPKERINTKPMIWQEFRAHNIIFGFRSIMCCFYLWLGIKFNIRRISILLCCNQVINSLYAADLVTKQLRINNLESTTSTMPYWENCSFKTQNRFKYFYAYCQYLATLSCISCNNIIWPFITLLPIQLASFLMTLVRKGLISAKNYQVSFKEPG